MAILLGEQRVGPGGDLGGRPRPCSGLGVARDYTPHLLLLLLLLLCILFLLLFIHLFLIIPILSYDSSFSLRPGSPSISSGCPVSSTVFTSLFPPIQSHSPDFPPRHLRSEATLAPQTFTHKALSFMKIPRNGEKRQRERKRRERQVVLERETGADCPATGP